MEEPVEEAEVVVCEGRLVLAGVPETLRLREGSGLLPIEHALSAAGFEAGDRVEVRLIERCPQWGVEQWSASRRG